VVALEDYLLGTWRVERTMEDAVLGAGRFRGSATFSRRADGLAWHEVGRMELAGHAGPAHRDLLVAPAEGGAWEVRFGDGRPFHPLDLTTGACAVEHPCGEDHYTGEYAIRGPDAFEVRWHVHGPHKRQRLTTRYERVAP
jgi:hypothetical protein